MHYLNENSSKRSFSSYYNVVNLSKNIKESKITPRKAKDEQNQFKVDLDKIKIGSASIEQRSALNAKNVVIKFFDDYSLIVSDAKATKGK